MTGFLWGALGSVVTFILMAALGDMVSEEVRDRLDHLPHAILRLAARRLDPAKRVILYAEVWLPDLAYHLKGDEARPVARLYHGTRFALGMLASARRSSRNLGSAAPQRNVQVSGEFNITLPLAVALAALASLGQLESQILLQERNHASVLSRLGRSRTRGRIVSRFRRTLHELQRRKIEAKLSRLYSERDAIERDVIGGNLEKFLKQFGALSHPVRLPKRRFWHK